MKIEENQQAGLKTIFLSPIFVPSYYFFATLFLIIAAVVLVIALRGDSRELFPLAFLALVCGIGSAVIFRNIERAKIVIDKNAKKIIIDTAHFMNFWKAHREIQFSNIASIGMREFSVPFKYSVSTSYSVYIAEKNGSRVSCTTGPMFTHDSAEALVCELRSAILT
ncbi:MAG: hypothetical protein WCJ29_04470 [bacterium]